MQYCARCLYSEIHPLGITFDSEGICSGCRIHEEKYEKVDWAAKAIEFERIVSPYRNQKNASYDCVIPVSGTGDDFYVVDLLKNRFGLNPLLVTYNTHFNTKVGIRNLARLLTRLDCDHIQSTVGPDTVRKITRETLRLIGDMYWHVLAGEQTFPVQVATKFAIPLIVWGCHGWLDQVGQFSHFDMVEMSKKVRKEHGLRMLDAEELLQRGQGLTYQEMLPYKYPSNKQLEISRVRGIYVNNFFFWNSKQQVEWAIQKFGFETVCQERTHNSYETIHCHNNAGIHDYIKYLKFGYGKATDHACRDIRLRRLSREEGLRIAEKFDPIKPANLGLFLDWLGISETALMSDIDRFRDPRAWHKTADHCWERIQAAHSGVASYPNSKAPPPLETLNTYTCTNLLEEEASEYFLTGRTYLDEANFKAVEG
jgi:N-acetyl sugar amidotransferase